MIKTTVYLETEVALALKQLAKAQDRSQAELIRAVVLKTGAAFTLLPADA